MQIELTRQRTRLPFRTRRAWTTFACLVRRGWGGGREGEKDGCKVRSSDEYRVEVGLVVSDQLRKLWWNITMTNLVRPDKWKINGSMCRGKWTRYAEF